jgi:hypothetical protein
MPLPIGSIGNVNMVNTVPSNGLGVGSSELQFVDVFDSTADTLTATPSGSQTTSALLTARINRITIVTSAGDGFRLPPAIQGMKIEVRNAAASNACNIFPSSAAQGGVTGGDQINALGQNTAFSLTVALNTTTFRCYTTGTWYTL